MITEPDHSSDETNSKVDTIAEEHLDDPEIEIAHQRRQTNRQKTFLFDEKESALNLVVDCSNLLKHDEPKKDMCKTEMKICLANTTYEIREDANPDNVKTTHRNHLIEYLQKEERLPPLITNYAIMSRDSDF